MSRQVRSGGLRLTKVGLGFVLLSAILTLAAINSGNNGLYLALAAMGGMLVVSHVSGVVNVRGIDVELETPEEIFANRPARLHLSLRNRSRLWGRFLVLVRVPIDRDTEGRTSPHLVARLARRASTEGEIELLAGFRGRLTLGEIELSSLFPLGFFHKLVRRSTNLEILVFPELFPASSLLPMRTGRTGDDPAARKGWGHDLLGLRAFRHGDDPRSIHWRRSASTGALVVKEREAEESRRLSIVLDNGHEGSLDPNTLRRFERLVSEAATAACDVLGRGHEVELVTRDGIVPFAAGRRQRRRVLETLALIVPTSAPAFGGELTSTAPGVAHLRLSLDTQPEDATAAGGGRAFAVPA